MASARIRSATPLDLDNLAILEVQAGQVFHSVGMSEVADDVPDHEALRRSQGQGLIWVAEQQGDLAGYIVATVLDGNAHIGQVSVAPAYARQGIGHLLISHVEDWGSRHRRPATTLTTFRDVPWNGPYYETLGYRELSASEIGSEVSAEMKHEASLPGIDASRRCAMIKSNGSTSWMRLQLDLDTFDDTRFVANLRRCRQSGITFTTMADLGDTAECRRALYELNKTCSADIPERGEFYTFEDYLAERIETRLYDPRGVVLAVNDGAWVGMAATSLREAEGYAFSEMTGVLASHRGRGISLAMKLLAIRFARSSGYHCLRTFHHPHNANAIGMNRRLGFVDEDAQTWPPKT
jgi:GNAT superfamily N-acetyltransferase